MTFAIWIYDYEQEEDRTLLHVGTLFDNQTKDILDFINHDGPLHIWSGGQRQIETLTIGSIHIQDRGHTYYTTDNEFARKDVLITNDENVQEIFRGPVQFRIEDAIRKTLKSKNNSLYIGSPEGEWFGILTYEKSGLLRKTFQWYLIAYSREINSAIGKCPVYNAGYLTKQFSDKPLIYIGDIVDVSESLPRFA